MRKKNLAIRLVTIFMLLTPSPLSTAFSSIHVATCMAQQFDKVVDNTPDSIAKALSAVLLPAVPARAAIPCCSSLETALCAMAHSETAITGSGAGVTMLRSISTHDK